MSDRPHPRREGGKRDDLSRMAIAAALLFDLFAEPEEEKEGEPAASEATTPERR